MGTARNVATCDDYMRICEELGCEPVEEFLHHLQTGSSEACIIHSLTEGHADDQCVYALAAVLPYTQVQELAICQAELTAQALAALLDGCKGCTAIRRVGIKGCTVQPGNVDAHAEFGRALGECQLEALELDAIVVDRALMEGLAAERLLKYDGLRQLSLAGCSLRCDEVVTLCRALESIGLACSLHTLDLKKNAIADKGAIALARMLTGDGTSSSVPLHVLDLQGNQIKDMGGMALGKAAINAVVLQSLNLSHNCFGNPTITACADALRFSGTLKELGVASSQVTEDAIILLLRVAACSPSVRSLDIRGVLLTEKGVKEAARLLQNTGTLSTLRLELDSTPTANMLVDALKQNSTVTELDLGDNLPGHGHEVVNRVLAVNASYAADRAGFPALPTLNTLRQQSPLSSRFDPHGLPLLVQSNTPVIAARAASPTRRGASRSSSPERLSTEGLAAGGTAQRASDIFRRYDLDKNNYLDKEEMLIALCDLGVMDGMSARQMGKVLTQEMDRADLDADGKVSLGEFLRYYDTMSKLQSAWEREGRIKAYHQAAAVPAGYENNKMLQRVFQVYCWHSAGKGRLYGEPPRMNSAQFYQLCKDAGFLEPRGPLCLCAVDIIFTRSKPFRSRRLAFRDFLESMGALAQELRWSFDQVSAALTSRCAAGSAPLTPLSSQATAQTKRSRSAPRQRSRAQSPTSVSSSRSKANAKASSRPGSAAKTRPDVDADQDSIRTLMEQVRLDTMAEMSQQFQLREDVWMSRLAALELQLQGQGAAPASRAAHRGVAPWWGSKAPGPTLEQTACNPLFDHSETKARPFSSPSGFGADSSGRLDGKEDELHAAKNAALNELKHRLLQLETYIGNPRQTLPFNFDKGDVITRVTALEARVHDMPKTQTAELAELTQHVSELQQTVRRLTSSTPYSTFWSHNSAAADALKQQIHTLSSELAELRAVVMQHSKDYRPPGTVQHFLDRQQRVEGALMQVAKKVDELDQKLKVTNEDGGHALGNLGSASQSFTISGAASIYS